MKKLITILILTGISTASLFAQTENKVTTTSLSGGIQTGGTFENTYIIGNNAGSATGTDGGSITYDLQVGFLSGASVNCQIPLNLQSIVDSDVQATIFWDPSVVVEYLIRYRVAGSNIWVEANQTSNSLILTGLTSGTDYQWQVRSVCSSDGGEKSAWSQVQSFTTTGAISCEIPTNPDAINLLNTSATIVWDDMGATSYIIRYKISGTYVWVTETSLTNSIDITGLEPGKTYVGQVKSVCSVDGSLVSDWVTGEFTTTGATVCTTPTNIQFSAIGDTNLTLSWDAVGSAISYEVKYKVNGTNNWTVLQTINTTEIISNLEGGTDYIFIVRTLCDATGINASDFSTYSLVSTTGTTSCLVPDNLFASLTDNVSSLISWDDTGADIYSLRYKIKGTLYWNFINPSSSNVFLNNLVNGITYQVQVQSICVGTTNSNSLYSSVLEFSTTGSTICDEPIISSVSPAVNSTSIVWNDTGAEAYQIRYKLANSYIYNTLVVAGTSTTLVGLQEGTDYNFNVRSVCSSDGSVVSFYSTEETFTTTGSINCEQPQNVTFSNITDNSIDVTWNSVSAALNFEVLYREPSANSWTFATTATNSYTVSGLTPATQYIIVVRSICSPDKAFISTTSSQATITTTGTVVCAKPESAAVTTITETTASIEWTPVNGVSEYEFRYKRQGDATWTISTVADNKIDLSGLDAGTSYSFWVRSDCNGDGSLYSDSEAGAWQTATPVVATCDIPTNITTSSITDNSASFTWTSPASQFYIAYRLKGMVSWNFQPTVATNAASISGLIAGTDYEFYLKAACSGSLYSNFAVTPFTTTGVNPSVCGDVTNLAISDDFAGTKVSWVGNAADTYTIKYRTSTASQLKWRSTTTTGNEIILTDLYEGMQYVIWVSKTCNDGTTRGQTDYYYTPGITECLPPTNIVATEMPFGDFYDVELTWDAVPNAYGYEIIWRHPRLNQPIIRKETANSVFVMETGDSNVFNVKTYCESDESVVSQYARLNYVKPGSTPAFGSSTDTNIDESKEGRLLEAEILDIYPNPFSDIINFNYTSIIDQQINLSIFDLNGRLIEVVFDGSVSKGRNYLFNFKPKDIPKGVYMYRFIGSADKAKIGQIILK